MRGEGGGGIGLRFFNEEMLLWRMLLGKLEFGLEDFTDCGCGSGA